MQKNLMQRIGLALGPILFIVINFLDLEPGNPALTRMAGVCVGKCNGARFSVEITNAAAEPLEPADLKNLAEPFWRKDEARSGADHVGLGLSVVSALAELLRLDVGYDQDRDGTFRVRLAGNVSSS